MLDRRVEEELLPYCEANSVTLQTYSPIEQGLLTGTVPDSYVPRPGEARENKLWWRPQTIAIANEMMAGWRDLTDQYNCSIANLVIAWSIKRSPRFNILCGARKLHQIAENVKSAGVELTNEDFARMEADADQAILRAKALG